MSASHQFENVALIFQWHTSRNDSELWAMEIAREKGVRSCCRRCSSVTEKMTRNTGVLVAGPEWLHCEICVRRARVGKKPN